MRNHLKRLLLVITLCVLANQAITQQPLMFSTIDSLTYQQYLNGEWKQLAKTGNHSIKNGLDFYYLRMRMGWAMLSRSKYRLAVPHYKKALKYNSNDPLALELLLNSLQYSGRQKDAIMLSKDLNASANEMLYNRYKKLFKDISFFYTHSYSATGTLVDYYNYNPGNSNEGIQKISGTFNHFQLGFSHLLFNHHIVMEHSVGFLRRNELSFYNSQQIKTLSKDQLMYQFEYKAMAHYTPVSGFTLTPGIIISNYNVPVYRQAAGNSPWNSQPILAGRINEKQFFYFLNAKKEFRFNSFGLSGGTGNINYFNTSQLGVHWKFFPLANLNLYYALNVYLHNKAAGTDSEINLLNQHRLGFKLFKFLWMEAETTLGGINSFYDVDKKIMYNSLETIEDLYSARFIIPFGNHMSYSLGFTRTITSSEFIPLQSPFSPENKNTYNTFSLTGGLLWNL